MLPGRPAAAAILCLGLTAAPLACLAEVFEGRYGKLELIEVGDLEHELRLNGRVIYTDDSSAYASIERRVSLGTEDVFILSESSGGNACAATYRIVSVRSPSQARVTDSFGNCSDLPAISADTALTQITFKFPKFRGADVWVYEGGKLIEAPEERSVVKEEILLDFRFLAEFEGRHPNDVLSDSRYGSHLIKNIGEVALDRTAYYTSVASGLELVDGKFLVGFGIAPHSGGSAEAFIAVEMATGKIVILTADADFKTGSSVVTVMAGEDVALSPKAQANIDAWKKSWVDAHPWTVTIINHVFERVPDNYAAAVEGQKLLRMTGYYGEGLDGWWGPSSHAAMLAFQRSAGLPLTGEPDLASLELLRLNLGAQLKIAAEPPSAAPTPPPPETSMASVELAALQQPLDAASLFKSVEGSVFVVLAGSTFEAIAEGAGASQGSAVALDDRHLLTNCHVIEDRPAVVLFQGDQFAPAFVVRSDETTDRCVLGVDGLALMPVMGVRRFADLEIGERVYTVGAPAGLERTLGEGIISGLREFEGQHVIQTTAQVSPGSSGGGLFDSRGNLIGITTFEVGEGSDLNFAIAAEDYQR